MGATPVRWSPIVPEKSPCVEQSRFGLLVRVPHDLKHAPTPLLKVPPADRRRVRLLWWRRVHAPKPSEPGLFVAQLSLALSYRPQHRPSAFQLPVSWHAALPPPGDPLALQTRRTPTFAPGLTPVPALATPPPRHLRMLPPLRRCAPDIHWHCWFIRQRWPAVRVTIHVAYARQHIHCIFALRCWPLSAARPPPLSHVSLRFLYRTRLAGRLRTTRFLRTRPNIS